MTAVNGLHSRTGGSFSIHPTSIHPTSIHPTSIHPTSIHPTSIHPGSIHPGRIRLGLRLLQTGVNGAPGRPGDHPPGVINAEIVLRAHTR